MASVLRNLDTGLFYAYGNWTTNPRLAQSFQDEESARKVVRKEDIKNADLLNLDKDGKIVSGSQIRISK